MRKYMRAPKLTITVIRQPDMECLLPTLITFWRVQWIRLMKSYSWNAKPSARIVHYNCAHRYGKIHYDRCDDIKIQKQTRKRFLSSVRKMEENTKASVTFVTYHFLSLLCDFYSTLSTFAESTVHFAFLFS